MMSSLIPPPWLRHPHCAFGPAACVGPDVASWAEFDQWLAALSPQDRAEYVRLFPAPKAQSLYYEAGAMPDDALRAVLADLECQTPTLTVRHWEPRGAQRYSRSDLAGRVAAGEQPSYLMFWKPGAPGAPACLGQWQPSPFAVGAVRYSCAEQYMMAEKARLFGDAEMERKILATDDPATMKRLGKKVRGFDPAVWDEAKYSIVLNGSYAKFSQDPVLRSYLTSTGDAVLVEASPLDTVWGIGLGVNNERAVDPARWRGRNLLGFALMETRDEIARVWAHADLVVPADR